MGWKLGPNDHAFDLNFSPFWYEDALTRCLCMLLLRLVVGCILFVALFFLGLAQFQRPGGPGPSFPIAKLYPHVIVSRPLFVWGPQSKKSLHAEEQFQTKLIWKQMTARISSFYVVIRTQSCHWSVVHTARDIAGSPLGSPLRTRNRLEDSLGGRPNWKRGFGQDENRAETHLFGGSSYVVMASEPRPYLV